MIKHHLVLVEGRAGIACLDHGQHTVNMRGIFVIEGLCRLVAFMGDKDA